MSSASLPPYVRAAQAKRRRFVTPEGVDLGIEIASAGARFTALLLDLIILAAVLGIATFVLVSGSGQSVDIVVMIWLLGAFLLRNLWIVLYELGPRAATPGKRIAGIRVIARDGGRLEVSSIIARNFVRELELFLPLTFVSMAAAEGMSSTWLATAGLVWTLAMSLFLLFNRDRMRLGDMIGGTWVVNARPRKMAADLGQGGLSEDGDLQFTAEELSVYGVYELQELERVLRDADPKTMRLVADTIRAKIGREPREEDAIFLGAYYRQLRARMERDLLFGKRRANKYEAADA